MPFRIQVVEVEPMRLFSFRWHPFAIEPGRDYAGEPMTLVRFELSDAADGVRLTITESGFDAFARGAPRDGTGGQRRRLGAPVAAESRFTSRMGSLERGGVVRGARRPRTGW